MEQLRKISKPRVLLFGAGVIGAYLAHVLIEAGNEVTILAREERVNSLRKNGLVIYHHIQKKTTTDHVEAVTNVAGRAFDAAFVVMPNNKLELALPVICTINTKLLVLVDNNVAPDKTFQYIKRHATNIKKVMFGFQATAGKKEENRYICERLGGGMDLGQLHGETAPKLKRWIGRLFRGTSYRLNWQGDMKDYLICHQAAILPIGYLSYACSGNLRKSTRVQRKLMFQASHEAYEMLKAKGITIYPAGDDQFYEKGIRGAVMTFLYFVMAKTGAGDLIACEHCRNCVSEMEQIDMAYEKLMEDYPDEKLAAWNRLRAMMPSWKELHETYGN